MFAEREEGVVLRVSRLQLICVCASMAITATALRAQSGSMTVDTISPAIRTRIDGIAEDVLKLQPIALRESGVALGSPVWHVIRTILWRGAASGILTGALLAFARISGETAPLLFTALNNQFFSWDMAHPMASLPVVIFQDALTPYTDLNKLAWAGALLIAGSVLAVTIIARAFSREPKR